MLENNFNITTNTLLTFSFTVVSNKLTVFKSCLYFAILYGAAVCAILEQKKSIQKIIILSILMSFVLKRSRSKVVLFKMNTSV